MQCKISMTGFSHVTGIDGIPIFVGFNAAFDWSFINYYFHSYLGNNPFGFSALDIKSLYMGSEKCAWHETKSSQISKKLHPILKGSHDALQDVKYQAELFRLIYKKVQYNFNKSWTVGFLFSKDTEFC